MSSRTLRLPLCVCLALIGLAAAPASSAELRCSQVPEFIRAYLRHHVLHHELTDEIEERTADTYLRRLDPSRSLLTEPEAAELRTSLKGIFKRVSKGDCDPLMKIHRRMVRYHEAAAKLVRRIVSAETYEIDATATLVLDPEKRGHPATPQEREDLVRRLVHFQMSNYQSNDTPLPEAKQKLIARYERRFKRFLEIEPRETYASFLDAFAVSLDPHSNYLSAEVLEDFRIGMSLSLEGIGVALSEQDGYAVAERIIPGGAADRHDALRPKDKIIAVAQEDGEYVDIIDMPLRDAVSLIRGKKGTEVGLTILRQGDTTEKFNITIVRDTIDLDEQAAKLRYEDHQVDGKTLKLAILELPSFYGDADPSKRQCTDDVAKLLREVKEAKADGLVLDLSRNGGGLLQHAVTISGFFLREGEIVGIENGNGQRQILPDEDDDVLYSGPLVVHTSRVSASASEILAGALKDYRRAVIVGDDHTFGKGTVQTVSTLPRGQGALKITTALFYRPGGMSTQHSGVEADVVLPSSLSSDEYGEKTQRYSLPKQTTRPFLGTSINYEAPSKHWDPLTQEVLTLLATRSQGRIDADPEFVEIREKLAEADANETIRIEELLKEREEAKEKQAEESSENEGEKSEDRENSPQLKEAIRVLTDLVVIQRRNRQEIAATRHAS
jgi:carboxyl-terminal processing protease